MGVNFRIPTNRTVLKWLFCFVAALLVALCCFLISLVRTLSLNEAYQFGFGMPLRASAQAAAHCKQQAHDFNAPECCTARLCRPHRESLLTHCAHSSAQQHPAWAAVHPALAKRDERALPRLHRSRSHGAHLARAALHITVARPPFVCRLSLARTRSAAR